MVAVILTFLSVVIITSFVDTTNVRIDAGARRIQSDIRYIQHIAMAIQRRTRLVFTPATDSYVAQIENTLNGEDWVAMIDPLQRQAFLVSFNTGEYEGVDLVSVQLGGAVTNNQLIFNINGDPFTQGNVHLAEPANVNLNAGRQLQITRQTGRVRIV